MKEYLKYMILLYVSLLAGAEGLEPSSTVLETVMLPLHQTPILATPMGLEPVTSGVTGRRSTLLNYGAILVPSMGLEPIRDYSTSPSSWRVCHSTITAFITCPKGFYHIDHTVNPLWQSSQIHQEQFSIAYVFSFRCSG